MTVDEESTLANLVPAAAVILGMLALFGTIGCKVLVGFMIIVHCHITWLNLDLYSIEN